MGFCSTDKTWYGMVSFFKKKFSGPDSATKTALSGVFKLVNLM